jgi:hypothetical protein
MTAAECLVMLHQADGRGEPLVRSALSVCGSLRLTERDNFDCHTHPARRGPGSSSGLPSVVLAGHSARVPRLRCGALPRFSAGEARPLTA